LDAVNALDALDALDIVDPVKAVDEVVPGRGERRRRDDHPQGFFQGSVLRDRRRAVRRAGVNLGLGQPAGQWGRPATRSRARRHPARVDLTAGVGWWRPEDQDRRRRFPGWGRVMGGVDDIVGKDSRSRHQVGHAGARGKRQFVAAFASVVYRHWGWVFVALVPGAPRAVAVAPVAAHRATSIPPW
jgi:hypothetical protein